MASILQKAAPGAKKTWLLYGANLSFSQYQRYLKTLIDLRFLAEKDGLYTTTEKGLAFLESYRTLVSLLGETDDLTYNKKKVSNKMVVDGTEEGELTASSDNNIEAKTLDAGNG
jgi:predicted transcriptional regulator